MPAGASTCLQNRLAGRLSVLEPVCCFLAVDVTAFPGNGTLAHDRPQTGLKVAELVRHFGFQRIARASLDTGHAVPAVPR